MTRLVRLCVLASCLLPARSLHAQSREALNLRRLSGSLESVVAKVAPAVVQIRASAYAPLSGYPTTAGALLGTQRSTGSGVVLSSDGYIVTNAHVVDGGRRFVVVLPRPV